MINFTYTFTSYTLAHAFAAKILEDYHPQGYMTSVHISKAGKTWLVHGSRLRSCD